VCAAHLWRGVKYEIVMSDKIQNSLQLLCKRNLLRYFVMQYDPIQGQGHEPLKVGKSAIFKGYLLPHL